MRRTEVENTEYKWGRLLAIAECQSYLGAGRSTMERIAAAANAKVKVGSRTLYDRIKIDRYLDSLTEDGADHEF